MGNQGLVMRPGRLLPGRLAIWLGLDGNPLRRRTDRIEIAVRLALLLVFLSCGPLLAGLTGSWAQAAGVHELRQQQSWHQVQAVLLRPTPMPYYAYGSMTTYWAPGRWLAPSGAVRRGEVPAPAGVTAGESVPIWVNGTGRLTGRPPLTTRAVTLHVVLAELATLAGLAIALLLLAGLIRWRLNRHRLADWAIEWAAFGPRWTRLR